MLSNCVRETLIDFQVNKAEIAVLLRILESDARLQMILYCIVNAFIEATIWTRPLVQPTTFLL